MRDRVVTSVNPGEEDAFRSSYDCPGVRLLGTTWSIHHYNQALRTNELNATRLLIEEKTDAARLVFGCGRVLVAEREPNELRQINFCRQRRDCVFCRQLDFQNKVDAMVEAMSHTITPGKNSVAKRDTRIVTFVFSLPPTESIIRAVDKCMFLDRFGERLRSNLKCSSLTDGGDAKASSAPFGATCLHVIPKETSPTVERLVFKPHLHAFIVARRGWNHVRFRDVASHEFEMLLKLRLGKSALSVRDCVIKHRHNFKLDARLDSGRSSLNDVVSNSLSYFGSGALLLKVLLKTDPYHRYRLHRHIASMVEVFKRAGVSDPFSTFGHIVERRHLPHTPSFRRYGENDFCVITGCLSEFKPIAQYKRYESRLLADRCLKEVTGEFVAEFKRRGIKGD